MWPSSPRSRRPLVEAALWLGLCVGSWACGAEIEPTRVDQLSPFERGPKPNKVVDPDNPLRNPAQDTPRGREGAQISAGEIELALREAADHAGTGDVAQQRNALRRCANKIPASARCDGELGLTMVDAKHWRATAVYYLVEAARVDDPDADAELYVSVGEGLRRHGRLAEATLALERAHAREPSAEHTYLLGQVLSLQPGRVPEAADRLAEARALDDRLAWLHDEAVLRGQIPTREQAAAAAALFETYLSRAASAPPASLPSSVATVEGRVAQLRGLAEVYPTQAEYEAQQSASPGTPIPPS